jgi:hypothetical protein
MSLSFAPGPKSITLKRGEKKPLKFPITGTDKEKICGNVVIEIDVPKEDGGTHISFSWEPDKEAKCDLCPPDGKVGWIQHTALAGEWHYDNNTDGNRHGAKSDPEKNPQPTTRPKTGEWTDNPWYGGGGNLTKKMDKDSDEAKKFDRDPKPQSSIEDTPGTIEPLGYIDELVCVETGKVLFTYAWVQNVDRSDRTVTFVGGTDLKITP